jgi:hypothetical protein
MTTDERDQQATAFVDRIIELNQHHGGAVPLSDDERRRTIQAAANMFKGLRAESKPCSPMGT